MHSTGPGSNCWSLGVTQYTSAWQTNWKKDGQQKSVSRSFPPPEFQDFKQLNYISSFTAQKKFIFYLLALRSGSLLLCAGLSSCREQRLLSRHGAQPSSCGGLLCCEAQAPGVPASGGCTSRAPGAGSAVVAHGLSCSTVHGICQGRDQTIMHCKVDF